MKKSFAENPAEPSVSFWPDASAGKAIKYWIDGEFVERSRAAIPLTDLAIVRGYAAFDALRTYGNVPFLLEAHLKRLEESCALLYLQPPMDRTTMALTVLAAVRTNNFAESLVRIYVTGGDTAGFIPEQKGRLIILVDPLKPYPSQQYESGIALASTHMNRTLPLAKSTDYVAGIRETVRVRREGFDEVVFLDGNANLLEGTTFNIGVVKGNDLISPAEGVLRGITVDHLLGLVGQAGLRVRRETISVKMLELADEVFITSSVREIVPVVRFGNRQIGSGAPGPTTRLLHRLYRDSAQLICSRGA